MAACADEVTFFNFFENVLDCSSLQQTCQVLNLISPWSVIEVHTDWIKTSTTIDARTIL